MLKLSKVAVALAALAALAPVGAMAQSAEDLMKSRLGTTDAGPVIAEAFQHAAMPVTAERSP